MKRRQHITKHNPWLLIIPCVLAVWFGWNVYIGHGQAIDIPKQAILRGGAFDDLDSTGFPAFWTIVSHDDKPYTTKLVRGQHSKTAFALTTAKGSGDVYLESREIPIRPGKQYFYKGYYKTSVDFDLVVIYHYKNGDTSREIAQSYPYKDHIWSTVSVVIKPTSTVVAVQFAYHVAGAGALQLDTTYFAPNSSTSSTQHLPKITGDNLITDGTFANTSVTFWQPHAEGAVISNFAVVHDDTNFLRVTAQNYESGEAKWQTQAIPATAFKQYAVSLTYRTSSPAQLTAEFIRSDGSHTFAIIQSLPQASMWTTYRGTFEAPSGTEQMVLSATLNANGTLDTKDYTLFATASEPRHFRRPLVSITFDDGWASDYTNGSRILEQFGYRGTFYINPATIDTKSFMTSGQIKSLVSKGHQLASHSYDHDDLTTLSDAAINFQLKMAREYIIEQTGVTAVDFASPYGKVDAEVSKQLPKLYASHRGTEDGINTLQNFDVYNLRVLFVGPDMTDKTLAEAIQQAKDYNGWLILVYHRINDIPQQSNKVSPKVLTRQMQLLEDHGMAVRTVRAALQELESQIAHE